MMKRRRTRISVREYVIVGLLSLLLLWLLFLLWGIFKKEEIARHAATEAKRELVLLQEREATLQANINDLATERGREGSLRETYGVARPGEEVIIVVPRNEGDELQELSWWRKFLGYFGL
jgi:cell division protein FtsB